MSFRSLLEVFGINPRWCSKPKFYGPLRCFRRNREDDGRCGIWVMDTNSEFRGDFWHGDKKEIQGTQLSIKTLELYCQGLRDNDGFPPMNVEEISCDDALSELSDWPEGREVMARVFGRNNANFSREFQDGDGI